MYKIPSDEEVIDAILKVLEEYREIRSQNLFHGLVLKNIKKRSRYYIVSAGRVRRLAANMEGVKIFVEKRKSGREAKKCYVCGNELEELKMKDLHGGETFIGKKCNACGFKIHRKNLEPRRYIFYRS
jgi:hypothetical protein